MTKRDFRATILIVEDEVLNFIYLEEILADMNLNIIHAKTGKEATDIFENTVNIDLILMDIKLPDIDGYTLTKHFKRIKPEVPVIAQTAYAMIGDEQKAFNAGCDDYISKPIDYELFLKKVSKFLT